MLGAVVCQEAGAGGCPGMEGDGWPLLEVQEVPSFAHCHCVIRSLLGDAGHASGPVRKHSLFLTVCSGQALSP